MVALRLKILSENFTHQKKMNVARRLGFPLLLGHMEWLHIAIWGEYIMEIIVNPVEPFADFWIDCMTNYSIAILKARFPYVDWLKYLSLQKATYLNHVDWGLITSFSWNPSVCFEMVQSTNFDGNDIHKVIRDYLSNGYYVLLNLDRSYFTYEVMPIIHPSLIYGCCQPSDCYYILDEIRYERIQEPYSLAYSVFNDSFDGVLDNDMFYMLALKPVDSLKIDRALRAAVSVDRISGNLQEHLDGKTVVHGDRCDRYGIGSIRDFTATVETYYAKVQQSKPKTWFINAQSYLELQKKTLLLVDYVSDKGLLTDSNRDVLKEKYVALLKLWEMYRNSLIKSAVSGKVVDYSRLKQLLMRCHDQERGATEQFLDFLRRSGAS